MGESGFVQLNRDWINDNYGWASTRVIWDQSGDVWGDRVDSLLEGYSGKICGLTVDAEGSDILVLRGSSQLLSQVDLVTAEFDDWEDLQEVPPVAATPRELPDLLLKMGFILYYINVVTAEGQLPIEVELQRMDLDNDPCTVVSWALLNKTVCQMARGQHYTGDILASRGP